MESKVFKDTVSAAVTTMQLSAELPVETEILIPDYLPQVFKIIKCFVHPVILQKQVTGSRLVLDGYLRCVVFYQAEGDQSLCQTEQKLPFTKPVELPGGEGGQHHVHVTGELEYLNCRAVNQRRVDVRGALALSIAVTAQTGAEVVTMLSGAGLEQRTRTLTGLRCIADQEKLLTAEEELTFPAPPAAVLDISGTASVQEVRILPGKAVLRGEVEARVLYRTGPGYRAEVLTRPVAFHQILDVEGLDEGCPCFACAQPIGCTLLAGSGPEAGSMLSVNVMLHLRAFRSAECCAVTDAFSTLCRTELERQTIRTETLAAALDECTDCTVNGSLPDDQAELLQCFATPAPPELCPCEDGSLALRGRATAHVFCMNSLGEIDCYDRTFEYVLPGRWEGAAADYRLEAWADALSVSARRTAEGLSVSARLRVTGMLFRAGCVSALTGLQCGDAWEPQDPDVALIVCCAGAGDDLFDIARHYRTSPAALLRCNHLEELVLTGDRRLLIPVSREGEGQA